jgi:hypothetical protein
MAVYAMALGVVVGMSQLEGCGSPQQTTKPSDLGTMNMPDMAGSPPMLSLVAGGIDIFGSTDGTGAAARFDGPSGAASDGAGNLYVTDYRNNTIRNVSSVENPPENFPDPVAKARGKLRLARPCWVSVG